MFGYIIGSVLTLVSLGLLRDVFVLGGLAGMAISLFQLKRYGYGRHLLASLAAHLWGDPAAVEELRIEAEQWMEPPFWMTNSNDIARWKQERKQERERLRFWKVALTMSCVVFTLGCRMRTS